MEPINTTVLLVYLLCFVHTLPGSSLCLKGVFCGDVIAFTVVISYEKKKFSFFSLVVSPGGEPVGWLSSLLADLVS